MTTWFLKNISPKKLKIFIMSKFYIAKAMRDPLLQTVVHILAILIFVIVLYPLSFIF